jgi:hypothetical protein
MKKSNSWLIAIIVMQTFVLLWRYVPSTPIAYAQIPDAGAQRNDMIDQQKATNEKLDKILKLLSEGKLKVTVDGPAAGK